MPCKHAHATPHGSHAAPCVVHPQAPIWVLAWHMATWRMATCTSLHPCGPRQPLVTPAQPALASASTRQGLAQQGLAAPMRSQPALGSVTTHRDPGSARGWHA